MVSAAWRCARAARLGACVLSLLLGAAAPAAANGRFPQAQRVLEDPSDPAHLILTTTFGLLQTRDRGASWRYVCEAAYGETDLSIDALTALGPEGTLLAGIYSGISRSAESPCDFERTLGTSNREAVPDFTLAASRPGTVFAIVVQLQELGPPRNLLYRSQDDGVTWNAVGGALPEELRTPLTIDVAPSDAQRIYLSGLGEGGVGVLLRSDDGGESFEVLALPVDAELGELPYIAAVEANNPDDLYVRTDLWAWDGPLSQAHAADALLYSDDGGKSFAELVRAEGKLFGFAVSPDGKELLLGYGDPLEAGGQRVTDPDVLGIYRGPKGAGGFEKRYAGSVNGLTWTAEGIYVSTLEVETGYSLGLIVDTDFDLGSPAQIQPLLELSEVRGPIECDACSAGAVCRSYWYSACQSWGRDDCEELSAPVCGGGGAGAGVAGTRDGEGEAGQGLQGGAGTGGSPGQQGASPAGGCGCRLAASSSRAGLWGLGLSALALTCRRSRRLAWRPGRARFPA